MAEHLPTEEALQRVAEDEDFVNLSRYGYSMAKLLERYPDGPPPEVTAKALMCDLAEVDRLVEEALGMLREFLDPSL